MKDETKKFHSQMMEYVKRNSTDPNTLALLNSQAKNSGIGFQEYYEFCLRLHLYNEGIVIGTLPLHFLKKEAIRFGVTEVLISSISNQEFRYSKIVNVEEAKLQKEVILAVLKRQISGQNSDIRTTKLPTDKMPVAGENIVSEFHHHQELIMSVIGVLKGKLVGYERAEINEQYYDSKNINPTIFNLSKKELDLLFKINKPFLQHFMNGADFKDQIPSSLTRFLNFLIDETNYQIEHIGDNPIFKSTYGINKEGCISCKYSHRIYINTPSGDIGYKFVNEYIKKCMEHEMPYDMKAFFNSGDSLDKTIIYSNNDYFAKHVEILETIAFEHPDWIEHFGTPVHSTIIPRTQSNRNIKNWYGVSTGKGAGMAWATANDYFDILLDASYMHFCYTYMPETRARFKYNFKDYPKEKVDNFFESFANLKYDPSSSNSPALYFSPIKFLFKDKELLSYCGRRMNQIMSNPAKKELVLETLGNTVGKLHSLYETGRSDVIDGVHPAISQNMVNLYEKDKAIRK